MRTEESIILINYIYCIILIVISISIFYLFYYNKSEIPPIYHKEYAIIDNKVMNVPRHVLSAFISKCRNKLLNNSMVINSYKSIDTINDINKSLRNYLKIKYGININYTPYSILNKINTKNQNINFLTEKEDDGNPLTQEIPQLDYCITELVSLLEEILKQNKSNIYLPFNFDILQNMDLFNNVVNMEPYGEELYGSSHIDNINVEPFLNEERSLNGELRDLNRINLFKVQPASSLRYQLHDYISDQAATDQESVLNIDHDIIQKNKNFNEVMSIWKRYRPYGEYTHLREQDFSESLIRKPASLIYADYSLPLNIAKQDRLRSNQKQSLTDTWDFIESSYLSS